MEFAGVVAAMAGVRRARAELETSVRGAEAALRALCDRPQLHRWGLKARSSAAGRWTLAATRREGHTEEAMHLAAALSPLAALRKAVAGECGQMAREAETAVDAARGCCRATDQRGAAAREVANDAAPLLVVLGGPDFGGYVRAAVLSELGVLQLWRLRAASRQLRCWATAMLVALPRPVAIGGFATPGHGLVDVATPATISSVEELNLATMRWAISCRLPPLPGPRASALGGRLTSGELIFAGGVRTFPAATIGPRAVWTRAVASWESWDPLASGDGWSPLPELPPPACEGAAGVVLADGRLM
jgi:hypothetical protein